MERLGLFLLFLEAVGAQQESTFLHTLLHMSETCSSDQTGGERQRGAFWVIALSCVGS